LPQWIEVTRFARLLARRTPKLLSPLCDDKDGQLITAAAETLAGYIAPQMQASIQRLLHGVTSKRVYMIHPRRLV